jgi:hypothetical protein
LTALIEQPSFSFDVVRRISRALILAIDWFVQHAGVARHRDELGFHHRRRRRAMETPIRVGMKSKQCQRAAI